MAVLFGIYSKYTLMTDLLVVEDDVGPPDVVRWDVQHVHASVLFRVPLKFVVVPILTEQKTRILIFSALLKRR
jgi:hypothetical protein